MSLCTFTNCVWCVCVCDACVRVCVSVCVCACVRVLALGLRCLSWCLWCMCVRVCTCFYSIYVTCVCTERVRMNLSVPFTKRCIKILVHHPTTFRPVNRDRQLYMMPLPIAIVFRISAISPSVSISANCQALSQILVSAQM